MSLDVWLLTEDSESVYDANITHNLGQMANVAGIYLHLWRPDELNITRAGDLIKPLAEGLIRLVMAPSYYKTFNSVNGWGLYKNFVLFVSKYLEACRKYPEATIRVSR